MLRNNKGYFLLDLLLSLSALFMIFLYLMPLLTHLWEQSGKLEMEKTARQLMFEELQAKLATNSNLVNYATLKNGVQYQIYWRESSGLLEVCVNVEKTPLHSKTEVCGLLE
jgi:competence protein ComGE